MVRLKTITKYCLGTPCHILCTTIQGKCRVRHNDDTLACHERNSTETRQHSSQLTKSTRPRMPEVSHDFQYKLADRLTSHGEKMPKIEESLFPFSHKAAAVTFIPSDGRDSGVIHKRPFWMVHSNSCRAANAWSSKFTQLGAGRPHNPVKHFHLKRK